MNRALLRLLDHVDPAYRRHAALIVLEVTLVMWPPVAWLAYGQDGWSWFGQVLLFISFGALWLTCVDIICTTDVRVQEEK